MSFSIAQNGCYRKNRQYNPPMDLQLHTDSAELCQKFCEANKKCDRFSFVVATKTCSTHNQYNSVLKDYPGAISGPKYCGKYDYIKLKRNCKLN